MSQSMELFIDQGDQFLERRLLTIAPGQEQLRDFLGRGLNHLPSLAGLA
jgi:hypothetical protein